MPTDSPTEARMDPLDEARRLDPDALRIGELMDAVARCGLYVDLDADERLERVLRIAEAAVRELRRVNGERR